MLITCACSSSVSLFQINPKLSTSVDLLSPVGLFPEQFKNVHECLTAYVPITAHCSCLFQDQSSNYPQVWLRWSP
eukprot:g32236.t1